MTSPKRKSPWEIAPGRKGSNVPGRNGGHIPGNSGAGGRPPRNWRRFLLVIAGLLALTLVLFSMAPEGSVSSFESGRVFYSVILLVAISSSLLLSRRHATSTLLKSVAGWAVIVGVIAAGYVMFQGSSGSLVDRLAASFNPGASTTTDGGVMVARAEDGHFYVDAKVNGTRIRFMVDTGASEIVLTPRDAKAVGLDLERLNFSGRAMTANGVVKLAAVRLDHISIGTIDRKNMRAAVNGAPMRESLLGLRFLDTLDGYEVSGEYLVLRD